MATINTGSFAKALWPGVNAWYGKSYNDHKTEYTDIFETFKSRKAWEEDVSVSSFGLAQVRGEGAPVSYDTEQKVSSLAIRTSNTLWVSSSPRTWWKMISMT
jgi:hypothetical protein